MEAGQTVAAAAASCLVVVLVEVVADLKDAADPPHQERGAVALGI